MLSQVLDILITTTMVRWSMASYSVHLLRGYVGNCNHSSPAPIGNLTLETEQSHYLNLNLSSCSSNICFKCWGWHFQRQGECLSKATTTSYIKPLPHRPSLPSDVRLIWPLLRLGWIRRLKAGLRPENPFKTSCVLRKSYCYDYCIGMATWALG